MIISFHPAAEKAFAVSDGWQRMEITSMEYLAWIVCGVAWSNCVWSGSRRRGEYFVASYFCSLDFDDGSYSLDEALCDWQDSICLIGTTKSHRKPKNGIIADRFRIVAPWENPLTSLDHYRQNQSRVIRSYGADDACKGGAQFFWPCKEIIHLSNNGYTVETKPFAKPKNYQKQKIGFVPQWIRKILEEEIVPKGQRNNQFFKVAINLIECGWDAAKVERAILASPTYKDSSNFSQQKEIAATVRSAAKSTTGALSND